VSANGVAYFNPQTTTTNAVIEALRLQATVSTAATGGANGFGVAQTFYAETATDATYQQQAQIASISVDSTDATRTNKLQLSAYDTAQRVGLDIAATGSDVTLLAYGKVAFTQTDLNEYIDSLNDGYMDYRATTAHRFGDGTNYTNITAAGLMSFVGTAGVELPHLMQSDSTDQAIANVANAQVITFDTDVHHKNITRTSSSRFTITKRGSYLITFSGVAVGTTGKRLEFWLRINDVDVASSNTPYMFKGTATSAVVACSFIQYFAANDYFEFWTWGDDVTCKWDATAAAGSPTRPAIPSIIMTCNYVSDD
jgi:hypothetical protein